MSAGIGAADAAIYTGVCQDNSDPLKLGRVKYCVPQLSGTAAFGWADPVVPGVTPIGASIYIAFEGGDRNRPIFWPDQNANTVFSTYSALVAAYPSSNPPPFGSTFWITDHGGSIQWQSTGITPTSGGWQWLPSGYQSDQDGGAQVYGGFRSQSYLLNSASFYNPSAHRIYKASAEASFFCTAGPVGVGIGIWFGTTVPSTSIDSATVWAFQNSGYITAVDATGLIHTPVNVSGLTSNLPVGLNYCASYLLYINTDDTPNIYTYPLTGGSGYRNITVEDVGATT